MSHKVKRGISVSLFAAMMQGLCVLLVAEPMPVFEAAAPVPFKPALNVRVLDARKNVHFSTELMSDAGLEHKISERLPLESSLESASSNFHDLPFASLRVTKNGADHARERDKRGTESERNEGFLRAAQHEIQGSAQGLPVVRPDIALKASTGSLLGLSQAASGFVLALGFGSNALVSSDVDLGGYFYEHAAGMAEITVDPATSYPLAVASDEMACFSMPGALDCLVMDLDARRAHRTWFALSNWEQARTPKPAIAIWQSVSPRQSIPSTRECPWRVGSSSVCVGEAASAWKRATAVIATAANGVRYVTTSYAAQAGSTYSWVCTSGCPGGSTQRWQNSNMTSTDATYGKALAMYGNLIAVGSPGPHGVGRVDIYAAKGAAGASGYEHHRSWEKVTFLPPPPPIGTDFIEYTGEGDFGASLSLSSKWLVIGAPGNATVAALIRIYKVSGTTFSHFCEVKHPVASADSRFGSSITQSSHESWPWTLVLVGAHGENKAYSILLRDEPPFCQMHHTFEAPTQDQDATDRFGFSVALSKQRAFVGTPYYLRWYKDASGLLYSNTFCFPGSVLTASIGALPQCSMCPKDQTSDGGISTTCRACTTASGAPLKIPEQSTINYGCSFTCNVGYFGDSCVTCSQYATSLQRYKPANSEWVDGDAKCYARCIGGYYSVGMSNVTFQCENCPSDTIFATRSNVQWIVGTCEWECVTGFFEDGIDNLCYRCQELKAKAGINPPANAEFVDGQPVCEWAPKLGYNCTYDTLLNPAQECRPCQNKPIDAVFVASTHPLSRAKCNFVCNNGFFGHPTYPGVCVQCWRLQSQYAKVSLPANAFWEDRPSVCTSNSWSCQAGYTKANSSDMPFCCPNVIPNSFPSATYRPCGRACNPGFFWNNITATCDQCPLKKQNHDWLLDCDFKCKCGGQMTPGVGCFYGRKELDNCYACDEYHTLLGNQPPYRAFWQSNPVAIGNADPVCDNNAWGCVSGTFKSMGANPPGCCPVSLPYSSVMKSADGLDVDTCGYRCTDGYVWDTIKKNCTWHRDPNDIIVNSKWNYRTGLWECKPGFVPRYPSGQLQADQCTECSIFAAHQGWILPSGARWLNASELNGVPCSDTAFLCSVDAEIENKNAHLCCPPSNLPDSVGTGSHRDGEWDDKSCEYRCVLGRFPIHPTKDNADCLKCKEYLPKWGVPAQRSCDDADPNKWCEGIQYPETPSSCTASITVPFIVSGMSLETFTANSGEKGSVVDVFLSALTDLVEVDKPHAVVSSVVHVDITGNVGAQRRLFVNNALKLKVSALLRNLDPVIISKCQQKLELEAATIISDAMYRGGYDATVNKDGALLVGPSSSVWNCKPGYTKNHGTGRCCKTNDGTTQLFKDPSGIDASRYYWDEDGCTFHCAVSFRGANCLSCTEYNKDRFKPDNSIWDDDSPDCSSWKCRTGYIRSTTGFACNSLKQLEEVCSNNARCATCVANGNCVWCGNRCVPGQSDGANRGCPFINEVASPACTCEASTCSQECLYESCSSCIKDAYCGWCAGTEKCMLGSYYSPQSQNCPSGWSAGTYTQCYQEQGIWMVGLISASVSTLLVLLMCLHFILRVRAAAHQQQRPAIVAFGSSPPVGSSADQAREIMARFLETFPTFKYDASKGKNDQAPNEERAGPTEEGGENGDVGSISGDEDPVCSICLGNFVDGEECRMLPCLHVFHKACIDHWFNVSQECPLCKRSVMRASTGQSNSNFAAEQARFGAPLGSESVDIAV